MTGIIQPEQLKGTRGQRGHCIVVPGVRLGCGVYALTVMNRISNTVFLLDSEGGRIRT